MMLTLRTGTRCFGPYFMLLQLCVLGCSSSDDKKQDGPSGAAGSPGSNSHTLGYKPCAAAERVGGFSVQIVTARTTVEGRVRDGVNPADVWEQTASEGDCRLLVGRKLFCNPSCSSTETCGDSGVCVKAPTARNVGKVKVEGLGAELSMTPNTANYYLPPVGTNPPYPPFEPRTPVRLEAAGGDYEPFALLGEGIPLLELNAGEIRVEAGKPVSVGWKVPATPGLARIHAVLDIAHHGGVAAKIECDAPDSGSLEIAGTLTSKLIELGTAGYPKIVVTRRTADAANIAPGCVDLLVQSQVEELVTIPGVVSCSDDDQCTPLKCQADLTCK